jgi:hypothetical protein
VQFLELAYLDDRISPRIAHVYRSNSLLPLAGKIIFAAGKFTAIASLVAGTFIAELPPPGARGPLSPIRSP